MPRGGYRPGAGRKPDPMKTAQAIKRYLTIESIAAAGLTPLEVMVEAMRFFRAQAASEQKNSQPNKALVRENLQLAANIAKDAAPYMHARVSVNDDDPIARLGKKGMCEHEAKTAGDGTVWSDIIQTPASRVN